VKNKPSCPYTDPTNPTKGAVVGFVGSILACMAEFFGDDSDRRRRQTLARMDAWLCWLFGIEGDCGEGSPRGLDR